MKKYFFLLVLYLILTNPSFSQIMFTASMDGTQETPPTMTNATGTAWLVLSPDFKSISFSVTYARLTSNFSAGHFHVAPFGVAGSVVFPLTFVGNTAMGTWSNIPDSIIAKLFDGQLYVNVHSSNNPAGEIRGQFKAVDGIGFTSSIDGNQENPPTGSSGSGTGFAIIENNAQQIHYQFTIAGLSSAFTMSHFHLAPVGVNGNVVEPVSMSDSTVIADWMAPADSILTAFLNGNIYFNVHSSNFPGGEMRGQMIHQGEIMLTANLTGDQEVPPVMTAAKGTGFVVIKNDNKSVFYRETFANLSSSFSAGHIHVAAAGVNGPVVIPFTFTGNSAQGTSAALADSLILQFLKGNTYMNVHSSNNPGGEIRGQLNTVSGIGFTAIIDGAQETPVKTVPGNGTGYFIWAPNGGDTLDFQVTIAGLTSTYAASHFHVGAPGVAGPVVHPFSMGTDSTVAAAWTDMTDTNIIDLAQGMLYTNFHTSNNPAGEIRGQVLFSNVYSGNVTGINDPVVAVPSKFKLLQNYPNPFNPTTIISFTLPERSRITLKVYDILGRVVDVITDGFKEAGNYKVSFDGRKLASGMYIYSLSSDKGDMISRKMMLIK